MSFPETNPNLLVRLRDGADEQAWFEFVRLYRPAIVRLASRKGLQLCDCEDLAQSVLMAVAGAIRRWTPDGDRARFRTWLYTVANRQVIDALRRRTTAAISGGTSVQERLSAEEERCEDSRLLRTELRRQAFRRAAALVREEFPEPTWNAFWLMIVDGLPAAEVSKQVGKTIGAVYASKGRVMRRLIQRMREMQHELSDDNLES